MYRYSKKLLAPDKVSKLPNIVYNDKLIVMYGVRMSGQSFQLHNRSSYARSYSTSRWTSAYNDNGNENRIHQNTTSKLKKSSFQQSMFISRSTINASLFVTNGIMKNLIGLQSNRVISSQNFSTTHFNFQHPNESLDGMKYNSTLEPILDPNLTVAIKSDNNTVIDDQQLVSVSEKSDSAVLSNTHSINESSSPASSPASVTESVESENKELILDFLPDRPAPLDASPASEYLGMDPPLESLGLASWWPPGRMQYIMEYLHSGLGMDLPWWQVVIITTLCVRMVAFPLVIISQRNVARLNNCMPQMQILQDKLSDARRRGDTYDSAILGQEMQKMMKEKNINPLKNMIPITFQLPLFMSMFMGLRGMANLPLESMMSGGLYWFKDLTVPDPFYVLPALTATSLYFQLRLGADGMTTQNFGPMVKNFFKILPGMLFLMTMNFPAAMTFYWMTTNFISVTQASILRAEGIRQVFGIPKHIKWDKNKLPVKEKTMRESFRETLDNWKVQGEIMDRRTVDARAFRDAGTHKPKRTFKHDPTKPKAHLR